ncbi:SDR family NAD(P)-dependent oxidoreductase [Lapillicoccus jejuensis]|uniref:NADP-dependent 3-hydroxy acid dehydrogenase YdfG n=1 Tax=Lapillicoccus jejuensis TaxID=402171 RepID=A0A542E4Y8_9MICO|nr:SDR family NAD(P)-dependent oxidoreductase [Lapillicoccus jejuensis]TQJ10344.1 NADP-dependent 3-hydroxy acid dehydrogenase YdfG [Lapillicoccus jejuensis]
MPALPLTARLGITTRGHFDPRVSIVTGGASGIGRAIATKLAAGGSHVVVADLDEAKAQRVATGLGSATGVRLDVTDAAAVRELVRDTVARHGGLDLMVNNAGVAVGGLHEQLEQAQWDLALAVNLGGVVNGVNAAYPVMREAGRGHILNTASLAGLITAPAMLPYTTTKHAVVGLSTALRVEAASANVRVSVLCPGFVDTPLLDEIHTGGLAEGERTSMRRQIKLLQPRLITPEYVADKAVDGLRRNRAIIPVGGMAEVTWRLERYLPAVGRALTQLQATGARRVVPRHTAG